MKNAMVLLAFSLVFLAGVDGRAEVASLTLDLGNGLHAFTAPELLARGEVADITIDNDADYHRRTQYRAVPLLSLLPNVVHDRFDTLEMRATDGFVAQIPLTLVDRARTGGAVPWIAIEEPGRPWPNLPGKEVSAAPFYLVWQHPERSGIISEQWPYKLASITATASPSKRWPQLAIRQSAASDPIVQRGQRAFFTSCLPCHRLSGGGAGDVGPDLGQPMNATE
ncbi:MAG: cytochrome c [Acetobacteraceae bacterium]|nr:cytochrome c [Acetobacteraceae bacterium]